MPELPGSGEFAPRPESEQPIESETHNVESDMFAKSGFLRRANLLLPRLSPEFAASMQSYEQAIQDSFREAVHEIRQDIGTEIPEAVLENTDRFYRAKAERQLRGWLNLAIKKSALRFFTELGRLMDNIDRGKASTSPGDRKPILRDVAIETPSTPEGMSVVVTSDKDPLTLDRVSVDATIDSLLASIPQHTLTRAQRRRRANSEPDSQTEPLDLPALAGILRANPSLGAEFMDRMKRHMSNRERYTGRKIRESLAIIATLLSDYQDGERILDLATGSGDIATILQSSDIPTQGIDVNAAYLRAGRAYTYVMRKRSEPVQTEPHLSLGNILQKEDIPQAEVWGCQASLREGDSLTRRNYGAVCC